MKSVVLVIVFAAAAASLWGHAAGDAPVPDPDVDPGRAYFPLQSPPRSVLNESGFLARSGIDDFVDVAGWRDAAFARSFFFAGGAGGLESAAFRCGWAGRPGGNYLGVYFSGDVLRGRGSETDTDSPGFEEALNQAYNELVANDNLIVLFGNEALGGLRFEARFDQTTFTSLTPKSGGAETSATPFETTLQWGRQFGNLSPRASAGISWGGRGTEDEFDYPRLAFKLEAAYGSFAADYQLSTALDRGAGNGGTDHLTNLYWTARTALTETLTLTARPQLQFDLYGCGNTASPGGAAQGGEAFYFGFSPMLEAALQWQITPRINAATGVRFAFLRLESKTRGKGDAWTGDTGSAWNVAGVAAEGGGIAFALSPSEHFTLEAGVSGLFNFNESEYRADITNLTGSFACVFSL